MKYATLPPVQYVCPVHPGILQIPNNATRVALYKFKIVYNENLWVFHKVRGIKQALIQQIITSVEEQYIISMKNHTTKQFPRNLLQIAAYLLSTYGKISPSHLKNFEKEVIDMHYYPVTAVNKIFNNI